VTPTEQSLLRVCRTDVNQMSESNQRREGHPEQARGELDSKLNSGAQVQNDTISELKRALN